MEIGYKLLGSGRNEVYKQNKNDMDEIAVKYPQNFEGVEVMWKVTNPANETMYFSIGAHPAFLCPANGFDENKKGCKDDYKLYFEGTSVIRHHGNDVSSGLALLEDIELPLENGYATITTDFFDRCTYMVEGNQTKCVGIADEDGRHIVDVCVTDVGIILYY